jgi:two-component sensor histidine kinase
MIFYCYDLKTNDLIFKYSSSDDNHDCISTRNIISDEGCRCGDDRFFIVKRHEKSGRIFAICFDGIKVRKEAAFFAKHTIDMFLMANPIIDSRHDNYEKMVKASIHNTKNLNSQITSKILSLLKEDALSVSKDKVAYIENIIKGNTYKFAREVLSILKISTQISNDYNVIDYLKPNITLKKNEFGFKKLHSILVISFYQFESDFNNKNLYVDISPTELSVFINYNTVQTILTHLFTNALKYSMPNTPIKIISTISQHFVKVEFQMKSLYLTDDILKHGRVNGQRTEQAKKMYEKGTGMGLGIINTLAELNKGSFDYKRISDIEYHHGGYVYSHNSFAIDLLKDEFY